MDSMVSEVKKIKSASQEFLNYMETYGNECAYTDRMVEDIIKYAKILEDKYKKNFGNFDIKFD